MDLLQSQTSDRENSYHQGDLGPHEQGAILRDAPLEVVPIDGQGKIGVKDPIGVH